MALEPRDIDAIAGRVVELIEERAAPFPREGLVDVVAVARFLQTSVDFVYEHQRELGAVRIGDGRGALRFEAPRVLAYVRDRRVGGDDEHAPRVRPGPRRRRSRGGLELLPLPRDAA